MPNSHSLQPKLSLNRNTLMLHSLKSQVNTRVTTLLVNHAWPLRALSNPKLRAASFTNSQLLGIRHKILRSTRSLPHSVPLHRQVSIHSRLLGTLLVHHRQPQALLASAKHRLLSSMVKFKIVTKDSFRRLRVPTEYRHSTLDLQVTLHYGTCLVFRE
jgi:hypothetical protein